MGFDTLGLDVSLLNNLTRLGYTTPTQVQREAIPAAIAGGDLLVSSQTGSGKTAAFVLPGLQRLRTESKRPGTGARMLVLAPTRELAMQVQKATHGYCSGQKLVTACLVGGVPFGKQLSQVRGGRLDIILATPGRLKDHMDRGSVTLERVELLVLDEADRMLDMGFQEELDAIVARVPKERQTLLFSATLAGVVGHLASRVTRNARRIEVKGKQETKPDITQHALLADNTEHKGRMLDSLLREAEVDQALVFTSMKRTAAELTVDLIGRGFAAGALHGDMQQKERTRTLNRLRDRSVKVLVATDVAARGIDVPGINLVVNYDAPRMAEDYVHRIGRTGRAGSEGEAVSLVSHEDRPLMAAVERLMNRKVESRVIAGFEPGSAPAPREHAEQRPPRRQEQGQGRRGGQQRQQRGGPQRGGDQRGGQQRSPQQQQQRAQQQQRRPGPQHQAHDSAYEDQIREARARMREEGEAVPAADEHQAPRPSQQPQRQGQPGLPGQGKRRRRGRGGRGRSAGNGAAPRGNGGGFRSPARSSRQQQWDPRRNEPAYREPSDHSYHQKSPSAHAVKVTHKPKRTLAGFVGALLGRKTDEPNKE